VANPEDILTNSRPNHRPYFLKEIEALSDKIGFIDAVHEILRRDNITVAVNGDIEQLREHDHGILFVGDHKNQWEFVALMDILSQIGRGDMLNIAKFYVKRQVHQAMGAAASKLVAPVYPRLLASDRRDHINSEMINRWLYKKFLLTTELSEEVNQRSLQAASERLGQGGIVNIFPCGSVVNAHTHPWRSGVGRIIRDIPDEQKVEVKIVPYKLEDMSRLRFMGAVATRGSGLVAPQTMNLSLAPQKLPQIS
jgi:hypothetical protein